MEKVVSATEARVHFGEMMRRVVEDHQIIVVERSGQPQMVLLAVSDYERLKAAGASDTFRWDQLQRARAMIAAELAGRPLPPAEEIINRMREERDARLVDLR